MMRVVRGHPLNASLSRAHPAPRGTSLRHNRGQIQCQKSNVKSQSRLVLLIRVLGFPRRRTPDPQVLFIDDFHTIGVNLNRPLTNETECLDHS